MLPPGRAIFFVNLPVGIATLTALSFAVIDGAEHGFTDPVVLG